MITHIQKHIITFWFIACVSSTGCEERMSLPDDPESLIELLVEGEAHLYDCGLAAKGKLWRMGTRAFPALIDNMDDDRYTWRNWQRSTINRTTVGEVCYDIIEHQIDLDAGLGVGNRLSARFLDWNYTPKKMMKLWWKERKGRTLKELQREAVFFSHMLIQLTLHFIVICICHI